MVVNLLYFYSKDPSIGQQYNCYSLFLYVCMQFNFSDVIKGNYFTLCTDLSYVLK